MTTNKRNKLFLLLSLIIIAILLVLWSINFAKAEYDDEEIETEDAYIICKPDGFVNIHAKPKRKSILEGRLYACSVVHLDGKKKNGFYHCVDVPCEAGEGWVSAKYIVYDEPNPVNCEAIVISKGRLAARASINGKVVKWLKPGNSVFVYYMTYDWCVTDKGYVKTEYLELVLGEKDETD